jgi:hypothetical protein
MGRRLLVDLLFCQPVCIAAAAAAAAARDYFFHKEGTANGGNRYATVLSYLSDVEEGGETVRHTYVS